MKFKFLLTTLLLALAGSLYSQATLSIQGTIQRSFGGAVDDGKYSLTFKLYTAETGGSPVWSETQDDIEVIGGVYSALLGEANPLTAGFNQVYYLGIAVDGGSELIPRTRLTSAPYALSLIGQSNTFPSAGTVGIGTASPDPNTQLTVSGGSTDAKVLLNAPGGKSANLWLRSGDKLSGLNINSDGNVNLTSFRHLGINGGSNGHVFFHGNGIFRAQTDDNGFYISGRLHATSGIYAEGGWINCGNTDLTLSRNGDRHVALRGDGWTQFDKGVYIPNGNGYAVTGGHVRRTFGGLLGQDTYFGSGTGHTASILANNNVITTALVLFSDTRIKKDLQQSNGAEDLSTLLKLEVTDYTHKDTIMKGTDRVKGFIAQQVEKVYPQAVTTSFNFIPSVFSRPSSVQVEGSKATFQMENAHNLVSGDLVRIYASAKSSEKDFRVTAVADDKSFTVAEWTGESIADQMFIYGKGVSDFRTVEYDRIHTLNVSATQELARRVAQLEAANAGLLQKNNELQQMNEGLRGDVNGLNDRLTKLEKLLSADSKR